MITLTPFRPYIRLAHFARTILALQLLATTAAFAMDDSNPHIAENLTIEVPSGETWLYSGKIGGSTSIAKYGDGTLVLSNPENDFYGGLTIEAGAVEVTAEGALGSSVNPIVISYTNSHSTGLLYLHATPARFNQQLTFAYPTKVAVSATNFLISGDITLGGTITYTGGINAAHGYVVSAGTNPAKVTFEGDCVRRNLRYPLIADFNGEIHFRGILPGSGNSDYRRFSFGSGGTVFYLYNPSNIIGNATSDATNQYIHCAAQNVINTTLWMNKYGAIHLDGFDQTVAAISGLGTASSHQQRESLSEPYITTPSDAPATLTIITGMSVDTISSKSKLGYMQFDGPITLVINLTDPAYIQPLVDRWHSMSGDLIVSNGICHVMQGSKFAHVPKIEIAGGSLRYETLIEDSLASVTNLTLRNGAVCEMMSSAVNPFDNGKAEFWIEPNAMLKTAIPLQAKAIHYATTEGGATVWHTLSAGVYAADGTIPQIVGGGSITIPATRVNVASVWTGKAENDSVRETSNWSNDGQLVDAGTLAPTFAADGSAASISEALGFYNIRFDATNDFTLKRCSPDARIILSGNTITSKPIERHTDETRRTYSIEMPLTYASQLEDYDDFVVNVGTGTVVRLRDVESSVDLNVIGHGECVLEGTNTLGGNLTVMNADSIRGDGGTFSEHGTKLTVSGVIQALGHETDTVDDHPSEHTMVFGGLYASLPESLGEVVTFAGANVRMSVYWFGRASELVTADFASNTSNTFYNVTIAGNKGSARLGKGSVVNFEGKLFVKPEFSFAGEWADTKVILNVVNSRARYLKSSGMLVFSKSQGYSSYYSDSRKTGGVEISDDSSVLTFTADDTFKNGSVVFSAAGRVELAGTHQTFETIAWTGSCVGGTIAGAYPSTISIRSKIGANVDDTTVVGCEVVDGVGFEMGAENETLILTNRAFCSCGDLAVTNGMLELAANATWMNGTNFTAGGEGVLKFSAQGQINGSVARLHLSGNGRVLVPSGVTIRVAEMDLLTDVGAAPTRLPAGFYGETAGKLGGRIIGGGNVEVKLSGSVVLIR